MKERLLRRNPLAAMALHHPSRQLAESMSSSTVISEAAAAAGASDGVGALPVSSLTGVDLEVPTDRHPGVLPAGVLGQRRIPAAACRAAHDAMVAVARRSPAWTCREGTSGQATGTRVDRRRAQQGVQQWRST